LKLNKLITLIFNLTANFLKFLASKSGFTYNQVNVIIYYIIIPFSWCLLLDLLFNWIYCSVVFFIFSIGFATGCRDFKSFSDWLFLKSVGFLNYFNRFGSNYYKSSVWICVSIPISIYLLLFYLIFTKP
jgi:hypothetical protein